MIRLYFDEDSMDRDLVAALRARGLDIATAYERQMVERTDLEHLELATRESRALFSFNRGDFYGLHSRFLSEGRKHGGIILANQQHYSVGETMRRLLLLASAKSEKDMENSVEFLSVWEPEP